MSECRKHWVWTSALYKPGLVVTPTSSALYKVKAGGPAVQDHLYIFSEFKFKATLSYWRLCLKRKK